MFWVRAFAFIAAICFVSLQTCLQMIGPEQEKIAKRNKDCEEYILKALPKIIEDWKFSEWKSRATGELRLATDQNKLKNEFNTYRQVLGRFNKMDKPNGVVTELDVRGRLIPTGAYSTRVHFRYTSADIIMKLVYRGGGWKFQAFAVQPDIALPVRGTTPQDE